MKNLKKMLVSVHLLGALFVLASCGEGGTSNAPTSGGGGTSNPGTSEETSVPTPAGQTDYYFEAEYVDLTGLEGLGTSGSPSGTGLAIYDSEANNSFALANLGPKSPITFKITSSAAATATFRGRFGNNSLGEVKWNPTTMNVTLNGTAITYNEFTTSAGATVSTQNYVVRSLGDINLVEGENTIVISAGENNYLNNQDVLPSIDYIRLTTEATLTWNPVESNIE